MKRLMCLLLTGIVMANNINSLPIPKTPFELYSDELPHTPIKNGKIVVQFTIDEQGNVVEPEILDTFDVELNSVVIDKVRRSKYTPAKQNGRPVRIRFQLPIIFE